MSPAPPRSTPTRTPTRRERLEYRFDEFMSRGTVALIVALCGVAGILVLAIAVVVTVLDQLHGANGEELGFVDAVWVSLLRMLDPGTMGADFGPVGFVLAMLTVTLGGIFIVATLIGIITTGIEGRVADLRKGRSRVLERNHIVIVGWSGAIFTILNELILANEPSGGCVIVIFANEDKIGMEDAIRIRVPRRRGSRIICRAGSPLDLLHVDIANIGEARSVMVLASDGSDPDSDVVRTLMTLTARDDWDARPYAVVAEVTSLANFELVRLIGGPDVVVVVVEDLIARVAAQACRQPGLSLVYTELLTVTGCEVYLIRVPQLIGRTFGDALLELEDTSLIGLYPPAGEPTLEPPLDRPIGADDLLIVVRADNRAARLVAAPVPVDRDAFSRVVPPPPTPEHTLVLGWSTLAPRIVEELGNYVPDGSTVTVVSERSGPDRQVAPDGRTASGALRLDYRFGDPAARTVLDSLDVPSFDNVIALTDGDEAVRGRDDAATLRTLVHVRDILARSGRRVSLVSQMRDVRNRELAEITRGDDFVVSDQLASYYLVQVALDPRIAAIYSELFDAKGCEIYLKPAGEYVRTGVPITYATVVAATAARGEIAIGYRAQRPFDTRANDDGLFLNPLKSALVTLGDEDRVIVVSRS